MARVFFKTYGCSANASDSEIMKGVLATEGHVLAQSAEDAEVIVLNICTVKGDAAALREVRKVKELFPEKKVVLAGCVTRSIVDAVRKNIPDAAFINTHHVDKIGVAVESVFQTPLEVLSGSRIEKPLLPKVRANQTIGIIQCVTGCDSACAFCSTKLVKGSTHSYSCESICKEVRDCVAKGCCVIWLTGTDMSCYGLDIGTDLPALVEAVAGIPGEFMIRVGMANPKHVVKYSKHLARALQHPKVFKFLHVPVQSGNDKVLTAMKRQHTLAQFKEMITLFQLMIPQITIATDFIVGFPGETEKEFEDSVQLLFDVRPVVVNISRFQARPGTVATRMPGQVQGNVSNERSRRLTQVFKQVALMQNKEWIGWEGDVVINEQVKHGAWCARNAWYKPIILRGEYQLGQSVHVKVIDATAIDLRAVVCSEAEVADKKPEKPLSQDL